MPFQQFRPCTFYSSSSSHNESNFCEKDMIYCDIPKSLVFSLQGFLQKARFPNHADKAAISRSAAAFSLVEMVMALGLVVMAITTTLLLILAVSREERDDFEAGQARELALAVASDLRLSLNRADMASAPASTQFGLAPLPLASQVEVGEVSRIYVRGDWTPVAEAEAIPEPGFIYYEVRMRVVRVPESGSLDPVGTTLEVWKVPMNRNAAPTRPMVEIPVSFATP